MKRLDPDLTKEYYTALERVPDIVAIESDALKHLRTEDGHAQRAATRVAMYWKQRRQYFGTCDNSTSNDRWLRPMTQTGGNGALSLDDITVLRSGYMVLVTLHSGLQIVLIDPSRLQGKDPGQARERCIFYLCTNEIKERSTRQGLEIIFLLTAAGFASERHTEMIHVLYGAMPTKVRHLTIVQSAQEGRQELLDFLAFRLEKTFEMFTPTRVTVVKARSRCVVLDALERRGIHKQYLPKQLGGDYDYYSQLSQWVQCRLVVEHAMGAALPRRNLVPLAFRKQAKRNNSKLAFSKNGLDKETQRNLLKSGRGGGSPSRQHALTSIIWDEHKKERRSRRKERKIKRHPGAVFSKINLIEPKDPHNERLRDILSSVIDMTVSDLTF